MGSDTAGVRGEGARKNDGRLQAAPRCAAAGERDLAGGVSGRRWRPIYAKRFAGRCQLCAYSCPLSKLRQLLDEGAWGQRSTLYTRFLTVLRFDPRVDLQSKRPLFLQWRRELTLKPLQSVPYTPSPYRDAANQEGTGRSAIVLRPGLTSKIERTALSVTAQVAISPLMPPAMRELNAGSPSILISS